MERQPVGSVHPYPSSPTPVLIPIYVYFEQDGSLWVGGPGSATIALASSGLISVSRPVQGRMHSYWFDFLKIIYLILQPDLNTLTPLFPVSPSEFPLNGFTPS